MNKRMIHKLTAVAVIGAILLITDVVVSLTADEVEVLESDGQIYVVRPDENEKTGHLSVKISISGKNETVEKEMELALAPYGENEEEGGNKAEEGGSQSSERERLESEIRNVVSKLNEDTQKQKIKLPAVLDTGESISWEIENNAKTNTLVILVMIVITAFIIYRSDFEEEKKRKKLKEESVMRQLPEFVNRLVLLLNAGMVLTSAFEKAIEENMNFSDSNKDDYFYGKLREIYTACKTVNCSINVEFRKMAKESGIRELIRLSNILNDNIKKGVALTDKLQAESEMLWLERKKSCEEKGKLAETKLTLPLMIFLIVLLIITVSPALIGF